MPIAPIQQYQDPSNSLMQILQGGNQQIGSILDRAIQIGRDIANKRTQQEQDLAAMRNQETAMVQRRGENLQSVLDTQQKFGMEQDKFDFLKMDTQRKYDANRIDEATRALEKDAAMQEQKRQFEQNYGLSARRVAVDEAAAKRQADAVAAEQQRLEAAATPPTQAVTGPTNPASAAPFEVAGPVNVLAVGRPGTGVSSKTAIGRGINSMTTTGAPPMEKLLAVPSNVAPAASAAPANAGSLKLDIRDAEKGLLAAEKLGDRSKIEGWKTQLKNLYTQEASLTKSETPAEQRAQARFEAWQQDRLSGKPQGSSLAGPRAQVSAAGQAFGQLVEGSPDAFVNTKADRFAPEGESEKDKERRQSDAAKRDKDKVALERQAALSMSEDEFVASVLKPISDPKSKYYIADAATRTRIENERRRAHRLAQAEKAAQEQLMGGAPASTESPVDFIKRQH